MTFGCSAVPLPVLRRIGWGASGTRIDNNNNNNNKIPLGVKRGYFEWVGMTLVFVVPFLQYNGWGLQDAN